VCGKKIVNQIDYFLTIYRFYIDFNIIQPPTSSKEINTNLFSPKPFDISPQIFPNILKNAKLSMNKFNEKKLLNKIVQML